MPTCSVQARLNSAYERTLSDTVDVSPDVFINLTSDDEAMFWGLSFWQDNQGRPANIFWGNGNSPISLYVSQKQK